MADSKLPAVKKTYLVDASNQLPVIQAAGRRAQKRFFTFFTDNIRNANTREAYFRNANRFLYWCEKRQLELASIESFHIAAYLEELLLELSKPSVKQHLASLRMLFDWLVVGQVLPQNPATSVRGPRYVVKKGKTPVLDEETAKLLLNSISTEHVVGLRDRAIIGTMIYTFARIDAVLQMNVKDYYPNGKRWWVRLHEKGGKAHEMPAHHKLEEFMDEYLEAACLSSDKRTPLFQSTRGRTRKLTNKRLNRTNAWSMVRRRARDAGILTEIGNHTFRATGITNYMQNGGELQEAKKMAAHESARTTGLYDRSSDEITLDEIERISI